MSTFLELCRAVESDSGTVSQGSRITSVATAQNRQAKIVGWVQDAWRQIQNARSDWKFMRSECSFLLVPGQPWYTAGDLEIDDLSEWGTTAPNYNPFTIFDPAIGHADENEIGEVDFVEWRRQYGRGVPQVNRPYIYALGPSHELCFGAVPDKAYQVNGEYRKSNQILTLDTDVPRLPDSYHDAIRYQALVYMGEHDEAPFLVATASRKFGIEFAKLVNSQVSTGMLGMIGQTLA